MINQLLLQDSAGYLWSITANDITEQLIATRITLGSTVNAYLNAPSGVSWQLGISTTGVLQATQVAYSINYPSALYLSETDVITISNTGVLQLQIITPTSTASSTTTQSPLNGQIIPLTSDPNQSFTSTLQVDGAALTLNFTVKWNEMAGYWVMSVSDSSDDLLLDSIPMITGWYPGANLLAQYGYLKIGSAFIINVGTSDSDYPGKSDLGTNFQLLWSDTPVQAEAA
jgi:hypothetical protein